MSSQDSVSRFPNCSPIYFSWLETNSPHQLVLLSRKNEIFSRLQFKLEYYNIHPFHIFKNSSQNSKFSWYCIIHIFLHLLQNCKFSCHCCIIYSFLGNPAGYLLSMMWHHPYFCLSSCYLNEPYFILMSVILTQPL